MLPSYLLNKWIITSLNTTQKLNFEWILIYQNLYNLLLKNVTCINNYFNFVMKNQKLLSLFKSTFSKPTTTRTLLTRTSDLKLYYKTRKILNFQQPKLSIINKKTFYNLFLIYLQHSTTSSNNFFTPHANFKSLFLFSQDNTTTYLNLQKMHSKWINTCNFLLNLFMIKCNLLVFATKTLKIETLSFNWSLNLLNYNLFKYSSPIFFTKDSKYSVASTLVFKKFQQSKVDTVFITDIKYHEKNLYYLKRFNITTIALMPYNLNPWLVTYAIPAASSSIFIQYFFLKLLTYLKQYATTKNYNIYKQYSLTV